MWQLVVERGPQSGQVFPIGPGVTSVGRSVSNQIVIPGNQISRVHFVLETAGQALVLSDRSSNGTLLNQKRIPSEPIPVKPGDRIQAGPVLLRLELGPDLPAPQAMPSDAGRAVQVSSPTPPTGTPAIAPPPPAPPVPVPVEIPVSQAPKRAASRRRQSNAVPIAIGIIAAILLVAAIVAVFVFADFSPAPTQTLPASEPSPVSPNAIAPAQTVAPSLIPAASALAPAAMSAQTPAPYRVTGDIVNVRSGPSEQAAPVGTAKQDAQVEALGMSKDQQWIEISCSEWQSRRCWISRSLVEPVGLQSELPVVE